MGFRRVRRLCDYFEQQFISKSLNSDAVPLTRGNQEPLQTFKNMLENIWANGHMSRQLTAMTS